MSTSRLLLVVAAAIASVTPAMAAPSVAAERRLQGFLAAGYDPLTAPVDWYRQAPLPGNPRAWPAAPTPPAHPDVAEALSWAEAQGTTALIASREGKVVVERYWYGDGRDTRFNSQSMAKTVAALMVGIAIDRKEIGGVDDPVGQYLAEWKDDARGRIRIRDLLQMASGLGQVDAGWGMKLVPENPAVEAFFGDDYLTPALRLPAAAPAGSKFDYNNDNIRVLTAIFERRGGASYVELLSERLWKPLGLADAALAVDAKGFAYASAGLFARPLDWLVIGQLILDRGRIGSKQVVSAAWIDAMLTPSPTLSGYGYWTWLGNHQVGGPPQPPILVPWQSEPFTDRRMVMLNGFGGQRVWILPSARMVIVRAGRTWPTAWDDSKLPNLLMKGLVT